MRFVGRIIEWNDARGFGFVMPNGGGDRAFVHVKAFERLRGRPIDGLLVSYDTRRDEKGRLNATQIRHVRPTAKPRAAGDGNGMPRIALAEGFMALLGIAWWAGKVPASLLMLYAAMSVLTFGLYANDKSAARNNRWRTPEDSLHMAALLGGWPGALCAQALLRHKSSKASFLAKFWLVVVVNVGALAWLVWSGRAMAIHRAIMAVVGSF